MQGPVMATSALPLFSLAWVLALAWPILCGALVQQLWQQEPRLYQALGEPVVRWLWWQSPRMQPQMPVRLGITDLARHKLNLSTAYSPRELRSALQLLQLVLLNRPRHVLQPGTKRLLLLLRLDLLALMVAISALVAQLLVRP